MTFCQSQYHHSISRLRIATIWISNIANIKVLKCIHTFVAFERLENVDEWLGGELFVVFGGNLYANLQILSDVGLQHRLEALQRILYRERAEVVHEPLWESSMKPLVQEDTNRLLHYTQNRQKCPRCWKQRLIEQSIGKEEAHCYY